MLFSKKKGKTQLERERNLTFDELYHALWPAINATSKIPLSETDLSLDDVGLDREKIQIAFKGIRGMDLKNIGPIDFICWLSTKVIAEKMKNKRIPSHKNTLVLQALLRSDSPDAKNTLRLFHIDEDYFTDALEINDPSARKDFFYEIIGLWHDAKHQ